MNSHLEQDLYGLLPNHIDKIIRYYILVKKSTNNLSLIELNQNVNNYRNIWYSEPIPVKNKKLDEKLSFNDYYDSTNDLINIIDNANNNANAEFTRNTLNIDFSDNELKELNSKISIYLNKSDDHLYIQLAPYKLNIDGKQLNYEETKAYLVERIMSILNKDYFNELKNRNPYLYDTIVNSHDLPTFNDLLAYSNKKYNKIKDIEKTTRLING